MNTTPIPNNGLNQFSRSELEVRVMLAADVVDMSNWQETNFEDGTPGPFDISDNWAEPVHMVVMDDTSAAKTHLHSLRYAASDGGSYGDDRPSEGNGVWRAYFDADEWNEQNAIHGDGRRELKGTELESTIPFTNEAFAGFKFMIPNETEGKYGFPTDEETIISQWFNFADEDAEDGLQYTWGAVLSIVDEDLYVTHKGRAIEKPEAILIQEDLPRGEWIEIKSRYVTGDGDGRLTYVLDEEIVYDATSIDLGYGDFDADGNMINGESNFYAGIYAYNDDPDFGFDAGQWRNIYYDDVSVLTNDDGSMDAQIAWNRIDPDISN